MKKLLFILAIFSVLFTACNSKSGTENLENKISNLEKQISTLEKRLDTFSFRKLPDGLTPVKLLSFREDDDFMDMETNKKYTWVTVTTPDGKLLRAVYPNSLPLENLKAGEFYISDKDKTKSWEIPILIQLNLLK